jgi:hypothetical protein
VAPLSPTPPAARPPTEDRTAHTDASSRHPLGAPQQPAQHAYPITYEPAIRRFISTTMLSTHILRSRGTCSDRANATTRSLSGAGVFAPMR